MLAKFKRLVTSFNNALIVKRDNTNLNIKASKFAAEGIEKELNKIGRKLTYLGDNDYTFNISFAGLTTEQRNEQRKILANY